MEFDILIPIAFVTAIVFVWYFYLKMRNKERMALIEKGKDIPSVSNSKFPWLKIGIIITGVGIGMFTASFFQSFQARNPLYIDSGFILWMSILIFGGIAMIIASFVDNSFLRAFPADEPQCRHFKLQRRVVSQTTCPGLYFCFTDIVITFPILLC